MKFLDISGLTSVLSKLIGKISVAYDSLEVRVTANESDIDGKADKVHSHEDINELIKQLYVNNYNGSEEQLNTLTAMSGGISETVNVGEDANVYICNNGDTYLAGNGETYDYEWSTALFNNNTVIKKLYILNGITRIGEELMAGCDSLTQLYMSDTVTYLGNSAFEMCPALIDVYMSKSLNIIDSGAFKGCESIVNIVMPDSVTGLGQWSAFEGCSSLANVVISKNIQEIPEDTFIECTSLTSITIPGSVKSIGSSAFDYCDNLITIKINKTEGSISGAPWGATNAEVVWTGGE